jgi:DNA-binding transcriptional LysR family regulator
MDLELRHLRVVCAVAEAGSVTKAASVLGLAQPALTAQLQRIERAIGGPLFERDRRGCRPTALGELVLARARVLLPAVTELREDAARLVNTGSSAAARFRIGAMPGPIIGGLVHRLTVEYPSADVTTHSTWSSEELATMVGDGRLDYALIVGCSESPMPAEPRIVWHEVVVEPLFVLLSESHPLATLDEVPLRELADAHWASVPSDDCIKECFAAACVRAGFSPKRLLVADVSTCVDLVQTDDVVLICQPTFRQRAGVVAAPLVGAPLRARQLIGWRLDGPMSGFAATLIDYAAAAYHDGLLRSPRYANWLAAHPIPVMRQPATR